MEYRIERDSMGEVRVPADRYWGAQTQRSHENFPIGVGIETMPAEIIRAFAVLKKAAAIANRELLPARMSAEKCALIGRVCDEILAGELDGHFPLVVWQTGSGTQTQEDDTVKKDAPRTQQGNSSPERGNGSTVSRMSQTTRTTDTAEKISDIPTVKGRLAVLQKTAAGMRDGQAKQRSQPTQQKSR